MLNYSEKNILLDPSLRIPVSDSLDVPSVVAGGETVPCLTPLDVEGEIVNVSGDALEFRGDLRFTVQMNCARCLKPVKVPLQIQIKQRFIKEGQEVEASLEEDRDVLIIENDRVDLTDTIFYEAQLGVPMRVLCRESCLGLCPICGKDLNLGPCTCVEEDTDPRWDALKDLFSD